MDRLISIWKNKLLIKIRVIILSIFILLISCFIFPANAQDNSNDDLLSKKELSIIDYTFKVVHQNELNQAERNNANIVQKGVGHSSIVNQIHNGGLDPNIINVYQEGFDLKSKVNQNGSGNISEVEQIGSNQNYISNIFGNNNSTTIIQNGSGNTFEHNILGDDKIYHNEQLGSNNTFSISDLGRNNTPPQIIQEGHDMNLRIEIR